MLCMYAGYPLGWVMKSFVRGRLARHLYAIIFGIILQSFMYREQIYHPFFMTLGTYLLLACLPRDQQHRAVMAFNLLYLSGQHIYRMYTDFGGWEMDITTQTMLLTARLSSLGFCYKDGALKDDQLLKEQVERKIVKLPSVLEMLSYSYFCCGCLCGPFFEYTHYIKFIEERGEYANIPSTILPALKRFGIANICLVINLTVGQYFWVQFCGTDEYVQMSFLMKVIYYFIAMTNQRFLYYVPWCIIDGGIIASGLGYNGKDPKTGEEQFDKILNINILGVELGNSPTYMFLQWNRTIQSWLRHYIFNRALTPGKRPGLKESMLTFIVSAFWHGFYPFYYMMFFFCALLSELSKDIYKSRILFEFIPPFLAPILSNFLSMLMMNYLGISFAMLTFEKGFKFTNSIYNFGFITIFVFFVFFRFSGIVKKARKLEEKRAHLQNKEKITSETEPRHDKFE